MDTNDVLEALGPDTLDACGRDIFEAVCLCPRFECAAVDLAVARGHTRSEIEMGLFAGHVVHPAYVQAFNDVVMYAARHAIAVMRSHWEP